MIFFKNEIKIKQLTIAESETLHYNTGSAKKMNSGDPLIEQCQQKRKKNRKK
jgi:hypothetical protein